jgi:hypothetical protein
LAWTATLHHDFVVQDMDFVVQDLDFGVKDLGGAIAMAGSTPHPSHESTKFSADLSAGFQSGLFS